MSVAEQEAPVAMRASSRIATNTAFNLLGQVIPAAVALVAIPVLVARLGPERFGVLALAWMVLGYVGTLDMGVTRATTKFAAEMIARGRNDAIVAVVETGVVIQLVIGLAIALLVAGATPYLTDHIFRLRAAFGDEASAVVYLVAAAVPFVIVYGSYRGLLEATQRFDLVNSLRLVFSSATYLVPLVAALSGWSLTAIIAALVIARVASAIAHFVVAKTVLPALHLMPRPVGAEARRILGYGGWVAVSGVVSPVLVYLDRVLLASLVSVAAVSFYAAPFEIITGATILPLCLVTAMFPILAGATLDGDGQRMVIGALKVLLLGMGSVAVVIIAYAPELLRLGFGQEFARYSIVPTVLIGLGVFVSSIAQLPFSLLQARGRPDITAKFHLIELPIHCAIAWVLVRRYGIAGAAAAWSIRVAFDATLLTIANLRLGLLSWTLLRTSGVVRSAVLSLAAIAVVTTATLAQVGLTERSVLTLIALGTLTLASWFVLLSGAEREEIGLALRGLVRLPNRV